MLASIFCPVASSQFPIFQPIHCIQHSTVDQIGYSFHSLGNVFSPEFPLLFIGDWVKYDLEFDTSQSEIFSQCLSHPAVAPAEKKSILSLLRIPLPNEKNPHSCLDLLIDLSSQYEPCKFFAPLPLIFISWLIYLNQTQIPHNYNSFPFHS